MSGLKELIEQYIVPENLDTKLEQWMQEVSPYQFRPIKQLDPAKSALLIIDMTKPFVQQGQPLSSPNARVILPRIREMADAFRAVECPVIWLVQGHHSVEYDRGKLLSSWWPGPILEGGPDVELAEGLSVQGNDKVIIKRRYSGFYQTDLELTLRCLEIDMVVICGVLTKVCPFSTSFNAFSRGFQVYYPADGTASLNEYLHINALCNIAGWVGYVVRSSDIIKCLGISTKSR